MKKFTNYAEGPRGVVMKDRTTRWIDPGQTLELDPKEVASVPDLGEKPTAKAGAADSDEIETLRTANAELTAQVEAQGKQIDDLNTRLAAASAPTT